MERKKSTNAHSMHTSGTEETVNASEDFPVLVFLSGNYRVLEVTELKSERAAVFSQLRNFYKLPKSLACYKKSLLYFQNSVHLDSALAEKIYIDTANILE